MDEMADSTKQALQELVESLEIISTQSGIVSGVVDNLTRAITRLSDHRASLIISDSDNYVDYQTRMVECAKDIAKISGKYPTQNHSFLSSIFYEIIVCSVTSCCVIFFISFH